MPCNENEWPTEVKNHASRRILSRGGVIPSFCISSRSREKILIRVHAPTYPPFAAFGTVYSSRRACTIVINHYVESGVDRKGLT